MNRLWSIGIISLLLLAAGVCAAAEEAAPAPVATLPPPAEMYPAASAAPVTERPYALGDSGTDVSAFKERLQYLGYFKQGSELSGKITEITMERVNQLLADQGMEPVETITPALQAMIFTRDDLAIIPTPTPSPAPLPFLSPQGTPELPAHDEEGFLLEDGEFVFADEDDGLWYYLSDTLYINIRRYNDQQEENIWYESEIKTRGGEMLQSLNEEQRKVYYTPVTIARENSAVLAFTDDFFTKRNYGVIIRNGVIYRNRIRTTSKSYPLGDTMAAFADGSLYAYDFDEYDANELLEMGAVHVLSFGPWLIKGGEINPRVLTGTYMPYHEPRSALGMIEPGHYVVLTADGRYAGAEGALFSWMAERLHDMGVTEALNLDGGGTTALVFMGSQISRVSGAQADGSNTRRVACMLSFGTSDAVPE